MASKSWSISSLSPYRSQQDPLADDVVKWIVENDELLSVNELFTHLVQDNEEALAKMPPVVREYFEKTAVLPEWIDWQKIKKAEDFFGVNGPELAMALLLRSLPASYSAWRGAEVLYQTGRLSEHAKGNLIPLTRRIMETSQFVLNVMAPDGISENGVGVRTAQKVRLIHAVIRYYLLKKGDWDAATYGQPINQEDMAGTLLAFSVYPIQGLERLGMEFTQSDKDAYTHAWNVIGHVLGVTPELLTQNYDEGAQLGQLILDANRGPSKAGHELTDSLINFIKYVTPGNSLDEVPVILMRKMLGNDICEVLGIEEDSRPLDELVAGISARLFDLVDKAEDSSKDLRYILQRFNATLLQGMINYFNEDKQVRFYIPPSLRENWKLELDWQDRYTTMSFMGWRAKFQRKSYAISKEGTVTDE